MTKVGAWASAHRTEVAALLAAGTGVSLAAEQRAVDRSPLKILPMDDSFVASQQQEADRFHALGLIPIAITVRDQVWRVN